MRLSEYYGLGRTQPALEFVDVDIEGDTKVYVDPRALHSVVSTWGDHCVSLLQSFFSAVLDAIQANDDQRARDLLASLSEPNETHLGLSRGRARGSGMGRDLARDTWEALRQSRAVSSGLLEDLEDTILFIEGIGFDRISDITTNIIRGPLVAFTQDSCKFYGIPLTPDVDPGRMWDHRTRDWTQDLVPLPVTTHGPLIMVPKAIVRRSTTFDPGEYFNHYVLTELQAEELRAGSSLVETLKSGRQRVTKKAAKEKHGAGKAVSLETTLRYPHLLDQYRRSKAAPQLPPSHVEVSDLTDTEPPDWDALLAAVLETPAGGDDATRYHRAIEALLSAVFYPSLDFPRREARIHGGLKRIDIRYTNMATRGFFHWIRDVHELPASFVPVECKNYGSEIENPEIDQLAMRFSADRGQLGILCHRGFGAKARVTRRCRAAALDGHGYVIALDDDDLQKLAAARKTRDNDIEFELLMERFHDLL